MPLFYFNQTMLPQDVLDLIAIFSGEYNAIFALKVTKQIQFYQKNVSLVYGQVQSGKTAEIMNIIARSRLPCVLIIQNSLLVLQQYIKRFSGMMVSTVNDYNPQSKVVLVMNNASQYSKFKPPKNFSLIMDESDLTGNNPYVSLATNQYHVTATPFKYKPIFDQIKQIQPPNDYYGIHRVEYFPKTYHNQHDTDYKPIFSDFTSNDGGILLINEFPYVSQMNAQALSLSKQFDLPIIVLSTQKKVYSKGKYKLIKKNNISSIIDSFKEKHIVIIAHRMANRGLSFVSSDYKKHITHQIFGEWQTITSFLQKSRIFGVYKDSPDLKVYLPPKKMKIISKYRDKLDKPMDHLLKSVKDNLYYIDKSI